MTLDKHRVPGSVDKHLPDIRGADSRYDSVTTEQLSSVYTHRISDTSTLESIDSTLSQGDVAYVEQPDTPYRTSSWIDIDTSHVTVVFESPYAKDGQPIVKVADGADVGGIRIGFNSAVSDVLIDSFGHDGNKDNQTSGTDLHSVIVDDANRVTVRNGVFQYQYPWHSHGDGGCGISVWSAATNVWIDKNYFNNSGDRDIEAAGAHQWVTRNYSESGWDRMVALDSSDGTNGDFTYIYGNVSQGRAEGSFLGATGGATFNESYIVNNVATGTHRSFATIGGASTINDMVISGNVGTGGSSHGIEFRDNGGSTNRVVVANNVIRGYSFRGIQLELGSISCTGNSIYNSGGPGIGAESSNTLIAGNYIDTPSTTGIDSSGTNNSIAGNYIEGHGSASPGIRTTAANNVIQNNTVVGATTSSSGISVEGGTNVAVQNNYLDLEDNRGINVFNGVDSMIITGNWMHGGTDGNHGIFFVGDSTDSLIANNYVEGFSISGIRLDGTYTGTIIANNKLVNNPYNFVTGRDTLQEFNGTTYVSANAETPSSTGNGPIHIDFTDTGDGSGDGIYYEDIDGNIHGPI